MLAAGHRLGPYEILSIIGAGGMGEVYRGRDSRIGRDVAIKILPSDYAHNVDRLRRFEQEARAAGSLNHSNIMVIYDIGTHEGSPYLVCEYLEGETLRQRMHSALSQRRTLEYAKQIITGLAAAHEKGIIHRDLKPENIFITNDERVKILDFGLAKLTESQPDGNRSLIPTSPAGTEAGVVLGTVGYMSPEQIKGLPAVPGSDIFAFGAILYEMLTGKRAFQGDSPVETMSAILKEDPPDVRESVANLSPALDRILRHCLEKNPDARFQSARDLSFDLEMISESSGASKISKADQMTHRRLIKIATAALATLALIAGAFWIGQRTSGKVITNPAIPEYRRLTFSRGTIQSARFVPDGNSIVYSASWRGARTSSLYDVRTDAVESRSMGIPDAKVLSVSKIGQLALLTKNDILAQAPLGGGAPREIMENVIAADWDSDGKNLVVVRDVSRKRRIEYPPGKIILETREFIGYIRFSPNGKWIAFTLHPGPADIGKVVIIDLEGKTKGSSKKSYPTGIAWRQDANEIWFSTWSTEQASGFYVNGLSVDGKERLVYRLPTYLTLHDISTKGEVLLSTEEVRSSIHAFLPGDTKEKDFSWLDYSALNDVSADGSIILFNEGGEAAGGDDSPVTTYFRRIEEGSPTKLGISVGRQISSDSKHILGFTSLMTKNQKLFIAPIGAGDTIEYPMDFWERASWAGWMPGDKEVLITGFEKGRDARLYLKNLSGEAPRAITPEGIVVRGDMGEMIAPDGKSVVVSDQDRKYSLWSFEKSEKKPLAMSEKELPIQWSADGCCVYAFTVGELPARIFSVDVKTGQRNLIREILPTDATGVISIGTIRFLPDGEHYAYSFDVNLATLHLVKGLN